VRTDKGNWMIQSTTPGTSVSLLTRIETSSMRRQFKRRRNRELHPRMPPRQRPHAVSHAQVPSPLMDVAYRMGIRFSQLRHHLYDGELERAYTYCLVRAADFESRGDVRRWRKGATYYRRWASILLDELARRFLEADRLAWRQAWVREYLRHRESGMSAWWSCRRTKYTNGFVYPGPWAAVFTDAGPEPEPRRSIRTRARQLHQESPPCRPVES
jgi:hypothetical protein